MRQLDTNSFHSASAPPPLGSDAVHIWFFPRSDRNRRAAANSDTVRRLLANYLDCDPAHLQFEHGRHGKPSLVGSALEFNVSHSADMLLVGLSRRQPLGVDLESPRRPRPVLELARRYFDPTETSALAALPQSIRQAAFLRLWSCKEAVLKALGRGIGFGLNRLVFGLDDDGMPLHLVSIAAEAGPAREWQIASLVPASGTCGALAWYGPAHTVYAFTVSPALDAHH